MDPRRQQTILNTLESVRRETEAFIIVGITEENFFYSVDERMPPDQVESLLRIHSYDIRESIERKRAAAKGLVRR